jgi:hypothetical protein
MALGRVYEKLALKLTQWGKLLYIYGPGKSIRKIGIEDDTVR